jgi:RimJ/RimL family protein N-acetyltransferase
MNQPIGFALPNWKPPPCPTRAPMEGRFCRLEPINGQRHAAELFAANSIDRDGRNWTYLPYGPFESFEAYQAWLHQSCQSSDPLFFAIIDLKQAQAVGVASYLRIDPRNGSIEVGHINYSPLLQRTPAATEAMYLLMRQAFELGYRRYEWKCDSLNAPSRAAAQRLGLSFEGIFRQAVVVKGRNRDTAWYAAIDSEWPALQEAFQRWLDPSNFDETGTQRVRLSELTAPILKHHG